jgi:hypothetical protein
LLVFAALLSVAASAFLLCKKFWRIKYEKVSYISGAGAGVLRESGIAGSYVK